MFPEFSTNYPLLLTTLMKRPVEIYPDEIGVVYRNQATGEYFRFTWQAWYRRTSRLANVLQKALGVTSGNAEQPGDRIATMALNTHRHLELYFAVPCIGATLHPVNVRLSQDHIVYTINHAEDRIIFVDDILLPLVESIYDRIKDTVELFVYMSDKPGLPETKIENILEYEKLLQDSSEDYEWPYLHEDTMATLCYTTGTTGLPKGAMFTHRALYLHSLHMIALGTISNKPRIDDVETNLGENGIPMITTPMFHIHAWAAPFFSVFAANKIVLPGMFTVDGFCDLVQTEKVTSVGLVPTIIAMLVEYKELHKYDLSSLVSVAVGGGALPLGLKKKFEKIMPNFRATSGYGMTETAPTTVRAFVKKTMVDWPREKIDEVQVKTGLPIPGLEVRVADAEDTPVPQDSATMGEIIIRGPWVMGQYYKNPEKTAEVWRDGWFHTGDMATVDGHGYITIADRMSDVIRSGSEMVPTVLLENLISLADFVLEATVVGVPDPIWGEKPMAMIKLAPQSNKTEQDIIDFLIVHGVEKGKITSWMLPKLIAITDDIPKTSVGKYNKLAIRKSLDRYLPLAKDMTEK
ncbi:MAG: long-chain-fatty-acid--CoA ligase [Deltaproteobacteria bacterium]|nr:long-chain-fatty-acid--CoA ligase [Deltaproteobacteria bacterium]MBT7712598.1 long-chain-fatty-acid--CoA ligase [Deltaproteobacteria bacterium]